MAKSSENTLVCWDLDLTMIEFHSHNWLANPKGNNLTQYAGMGTVIAFNGIDEISPSTRARRIKDTEVVDTYTPDRVVAAIDRFLQEKGDDAFILKEKLKETFIQLHAQGHCMAITTFSQFPHAVVRIIDALELPEEVRSQLLFVTGFPKNIDKNSRDFRGKLDHIELAKEHFGITSNALVMLIDDCDKNCGVARGNGMRAVQIPARSRDRYFDIAVKAGVQMREEAISSNVVDASPPSGEASPYHSPPASPLRSSQGSSEGPSLRRSCGDQERGSWVLRVSGDGEEISTTSRVFQ